MRLQIRLCVLTSILLSFGCGGGGDAPRADESSATAERSSANEIDAAGNITATVDGEERIWKVLLVQTESGTRSTGVHRSRWVGRSLMRTITLDGHVGDNVATRGMISLQLTTTDPLDDCPCALEDQTIEYWVSGSESYDARDASFTIDRFVEAGDGWYEAAGSFSGTLVPAEENAGAGTGEPMRIEGTFDVDRIRPLDI